MEFRWLGLSVYQDVESYQKKLVEQIQGTSKVLVLGLEFLPVLTMGIRSGPEDLIWTREKIQALGLDLVETDRGGQATIHSPGQLVIYPMLDLRQQGRGIKSFVNLLMNTTVRTLENLDIQSHYNCRSPGVYTTAGKISFCGIKLDRQVVRHGLSINVCNDAGLFSGIRSCGQQQASFDSVSQHRPLGTEELFLAWSQQFQKDFQLSAPSTLDMTTSIQQ